MSSSKAITFSLFSTRYFQNTSQSLPGHQYKKRDLIIKARFYFFRFFFQLILINPFGGITIFINQPIPIEPLFFLNLFLISFFVLTTDLKASVLPTFQE